MEIKKKHSLKEYVTCVLIWALFFIPPLVFIPGKFGEQWIFVSYREPKLAAVQILAWLLITWTILSFFRQFKATFSTSSDLAKVIFYLLSLFTLYSCLSASWAMVPQASLYEASQWATVCFLYLILLVLFSSSPKYRNIALYSLVFSFALVTIIGLIQTKIQIPFLLPASKIHAFASTFGAKNTCFVTLASQIFLLLFLIVQKIGQKKLPMVFLLGALFLLELFYLFISSSRTSYVAVSAGITIFLIFLMTTRPFKISKKTVVIMSVSVTAVIVAASMVLISNVRTNLVSNPGFELGTYDNLLPKDWFLYPSNAKNPGNKCGAWSNKVSHSGRYSVAIYGKDKFQTGWRGKQIHFEHPLPHLISIKGWSKAKEVKTQEKNYTLLFKIFFADKSYTWFRPTELHFSQGTHGWELRQSTKYWPKAVTSIQPYCILYNGSGTAWFDDIIVQRYNNIFAFLYNFFTTWKGRIFPYLLDPSRFFYETARGAALLDTFDMFTEHPIGVGAGNWGFAYPLYHKHMIAKSFSERVQIRRAHNDFVEILGELGPFGLLIFLAVITILIIKTVAFILHQKDIVERLLISCLLCQIIVMCITMTLTFYLEYPYRKFLFMYIVLFTIVTLQNEKRVVLTTP